MINKLHLLGLSCLPFTPTLTRFSFDADFGNTVAISGKIRSARMGKNGRDTHWHGADDSDDGEGVENGESDAGAGEGSRTEGDGVTIDASNEVPEMYRQEEGTKSATAAVNVATEAAEGTISAADAPVEREVADTSRATTAAENSSVNSPAESKRVSFAVDSTRTATAVTDAGEETGNAPP
jgi:hypothetical protein